MLITEWGISTLDVTRSPFQQVREDYQSFQYIVHHTETL
jgi:hypothetical protein